MHPSTTVGHTTTSSIVSPQATPTHAPYIRTARPLGKRDAGQEKSSLSYLPKKQALNVSSGRTTTAITTATATMTSMLQSRLMSADQSVITESDTGSGFVSHSTDTSQNPTYYDETLKLKVTGDKSAEYWTIVEPDYFADLEGASSTPVVTSRVYKPSYQVSSGRSDTQSINVSDSDRVIDITLSDSEGEDTACTAPTSQYIHAPSELRIVTGTAKETVVESGSGEQGATSKGLSTKKQRQMHAKHLFTCEACGVGFTWETKFSEHMFSVHNKKIYECKSCEKGFVKKDKLREHQKIHTGERSQGTLCKYCGKCFATSYFLKKHQKYRCTALLSPQQRAVALRTKTPSSQGDEQPEVISGGEGTTRSVSTAQLIPVRSELQVGIGTEIAGKQDSEHRNWLCEYCGECFELTAIFIEHLKNYHRKTVECVYHCNKCAAAFSSLIPFEEHIWNAHKVFPATCKYCDKGFKHRKDLDNHLIAIHNLVRPAKYICGSCGKSYLKYKYLMRHRVENKCPVLLRKERAASASSTLTHQVYQTPSEYDTSLSEREGVTGRSFTTQPVIPVPVEEIQGQVVIGEDKKPTAESCPENRTSSCKLCGECYENPEGLKKHICKVLIERLKKTKRPPDAG